MGSSTDINTDARTFTVRAVAQDGVRTCPCGAKQRCARRYVRTYVIFQIWFLDRKSIDLDVHLSAPFGAAPSYGHDDIGSNGGARACAPCW